jgi:hypothetical protein
LYLHACSKFDSWPQCTVTCPKLVAVAGCKCSSKRIPAMHYHCHQHNTFDSIRHCRLVPLH